MRGLCRLFDAPSQKSGAHQLDQLASAPVVMCRLETFDVGSLCSSAQIPLEKPCVGRRVKRSTIAEETARGSIECSHFLRPPPVGSPSLAGLRCRCNVKNPDALFQLRVVVSDPAERHDVVSQPGHAMIPVILPSTDLSSACAILDRKSVV